jgi:hypothetical protein
MKALPEPVEGSAKGVSDKACEGKLCDLRTVGRLKAPLPFLQAAAFIGATLCGIIHLHGLTPCVYLALFVIFVRNEWE